jgi:hypothetical protein
LFFCALLRLFAEGEEGQATKRFENTFASKNQRFFENPHSLPKVGIGATKATALLALPSRSVHTHRILGVTPKEM